MESKIVKITDKGQISIPHSFREIIGLDKGDNLLMIQAGNSIIMEKITENRFKDMLKHSENVAKKLWSKKEDDVWDKV